MGNSNYKLLRLERLKNGLCTKCGKPLDRDGSFCVSCNAKKNAYMKKRRQNLDEQGLCIRCGKPRKDLDYKECFDCRDKNTKYRISKVASRRDADNLYRKKKYKELKEKGLCTKCGKTMDRDGSLCSECLVKKNKNYNENREWYLNARICPCCRTNNLFGDEQSCPECRAKKKQRSEESKNKAKQSKKILYEKRKESGLCVDCGIELEDGREKVRCEKCCEYRRKLTKKHNDRKRKESNKIPPDERWKYGLCRWCDNERLPDRQFCKEHMEKIIQRNRVETEKRREAKRKQGLSTYGRKKQNG